MDTNNMGSPYYSLPWRRLLPPFCRGREKGIKEAIMVFSPAGWLVVREKRKAVGRVGGCMRGAWGGVTVCDVSHDNVLACPAFRCREKNPLIRLDRSKLHYGQGRLRV